MNDVMNNGNDVNYVNFLKIYTRVVKFLHPH